MNKDLFLALLAMDSYNRGYGQALNVSGNVLGNTILSRQSNIAPNSNEVNAGFYASAYVVNGVEGIADGSTVISYRGTDTSTLGATVTDARYGWLIGAGSSTAAQAGLAITFYKAATGQTSAFDPAPANVILTGHSLGGGLAGYVSALSGAESLLFNYMPFGIAAQQAEALAGNAAADAQIGKPKAYTTQGEFLDKVRDGTYQGILNSIVSGFISAGSEGNYVDPVVVVDGVRTVALDASVTKTPVSAEGAPIGATDLHSQAMLVDLLWAKTVWASRAPVNSNWQAAARYFLPALLDETVAAADGFKQGDAANDPSATGANVASDQMSKAIAYSALGDGGANEGATPFGDTAIWSMFNDAGELGKVLEGTESSFFAESVTTHYTPYTMLGFGGHEAIPIDIKQALANMLVQYAGAQAINHISEADSLRGMATPGQADVSQGILALSGNNSVLSLDLSSVLWKDALGGTAVAPVDAADFRKVYFDKAKVAGLADVLGGFSLFGFTIGGLSLDELAQQMWEASDAHVIDRFDIAASDQAGTFTLTARSYAAPLVHGESAHVDVFAGTSGNDMIIGTDGHDILLGGAGNGNDWIEGKAGDDVIAGGAGNDRLDGGANADRVFGGAGDDLIIANLDGANDSYDGGSGDDTIVYKYAGGNSLIRIINDPALAGLPFIGRNTQGDFGLAISRAIGPNGETSFGKDTLGPNGETIVGVDTLSSIEKAAVEAGDGADALVIDNTSDGGHISYVDLGGQAAGAFDTIDLRQLTLGATVDLSKDSLHWESPGLLFGPYWTYKYDVAVRNAEAVLGGSGDDVLTGGLNKNSQYLLDGGQGNDVLKLTAGAAGSLAIGGVGRDIIDNNVKGGVIWGDRANTFLFRKGRRSPMRGSLKVVLRRVMVSSRRSMFCRVTRAVMCQPVSISTGMPSL